MSPIEPTLLQEIWEQAAVQPPVLRALTLLRLTEPATSLEELAGLPIGERDRRLLHLRERCIGSEFESTGSCPRCGECAELSFSCNDLRQPGSSLACDELRVTSGAWSVRARVPCTADLLAVALDRTQAGRHLLLRCVVSAEHDGQPQRSESLPECVLLAVESALAEADPMGDLAVASSCPSCGHAHSLVFDIGSYLWQELDARACKLLREVHVLARAYGWREADILALSELRRQRYLELVAE